MIPPSERHEYDVSVGRILDVASRLIVPAVLLLILWRVW
jgi:hypothetical protein